jgi:hypothetical protein
MSAIVGTLPANIQNGTTADASQVMANLNFIVNQVNSNGMPNDVTSLPDVTSIGGAIEVGNETTVTIGSATASSEVDVLLSNSNTLGAIFLQASGAMGFNDSTRSLVRWQSDTSGNFVAAGNVTSSSDEKLKKDWKPLPADFIERLAGVLSGTYTRTDTGERHAGVGAQSMREVLAEVVFGDQELSVAYGNAALVACIALAQEVLRLRTLLEPAR